MSDAPASKVQLFFCTDEGRELCNWKWGLRRDGQECDTLATMATTASISNTSGADNDDVDDVVVRVGSRRHDGDIGDDDCDDGHTFQVKDRSPSTYARGVPE